MLSCFPPPKVHTLSSLLFQQFPRSSSRTAHTSSKACAPHSSTAWSTMEPSRPTASSASTSSSSTQWARGRKSALSWWRSRQGRTRGIGSGRQQTSPRPTYPRREASAARPAPCTATCRRRRLAGAATRTVGPRLGETSPIPTAAPAALATGPTTPPPPPDPSCEHRRLASPLPPFPASICTLIAG